MHFPVTHSLSIVLGCVLWVARKAHRAFWCAARPSTTPHFNTLVSKWLGELRGLLLWDPLKALRPSKQNIFSSLMHYSQEGTFPPKHINWRLRAQCPSTDSLAQNPKKQKRDERKASVAQQVISIQQMYLFEGWAIFHFDALP